MRLFQFRLALCNIAFASFQAGSSDWGIFSGDKLLMSVWFITVEQLSHYRMEKGCDNVLSLWAGSIKFCLTGQSNFVWRVSLFDMCRINNPVRGIFTKSLNLSGEKPSNFLNLGMLGFGRLSSRVPQNCGRQILHIAIDPNLTNYRCEIFWVSPV